MAGRTVRVLIAGVAAAATACNGSTPSADRGPSISRNPAVLVDGEAYQPRIDPARFVDRIDNPYMPLVPGTTRIYEGISDGERERTEVTVTNQTKEILGVTVTVVRDRVFVDGELAEDTFDWFAQDTQGNVWYFGEESTEYDGKKTSTAGSWEAGVDGARPGIVMLGQPRIGDAYRQEYYAGEAEDMGRVLSLSESVTVPFGAFDRVLMTEDWTPLEPQILERKLYARGIGVVLERAVEGGQELLRLVEVNGQPAA